MSKQCHERDIEREREIKRGRLTETIPLLVLVLVLNLVF
jgi:hypothetical protein